MKKLFGSRFMDEEEMKDMGEDYPVKLEYYKVKEESFGVEVVKKIYKEDGVEVEKSSVKYIANEEKKADEVIQALKQNKVTPLSINDVIEDFIYQE